MRCLGQRVGRVAARTAGPRSSEIGTLTTYPGSTSESERAGSAFAAPHRSVARFPVSEQGADRDKPWKCLPLDSAVLPPRYKQIREHQARTDKEESSAHADPETCAVGQGQTSDQCGQAEKYPAYSNRTRNRLLARTVPPILHTHLPILSLIHTTDSRGHAESFQFAGQLHLEAVGLTGLLRFGCAFDQD